MKLRDVDDQHLVQLATRVPRDIARRMKEFCIRRDVQLQRFIRAALSEKLARARRRRA